MRDEGSLLLDKVVEIAEPVVVLLDCEPRYPPNDFPEQIHHGGHIMDFDAEGGGL